MIQIKADSDGKVYYIRYDGMKIDGAVEVAAIPEPQEVDGTVAVMYYRNGRIEYEYEPVPTAQELEARMRAREAQQP